MDAQCAFTADTQSKHIIVGMKVVGYDVGYSTFDYCSGALGQISFQAPTRQHAVEISVFIDEHLAASLAVG
jgi:hypothetical protein